MSPRARGVEEEERPPRYEERVDRDPFSDPFSDVVDGEEDDDERPDGDERRVTSGGESATRDRRGLSRESSGNSIGAKPQVVKSMLDI